MTDIRVIDNGNGSKTLTVTAPTEDIKRALEALSTGCTRQYSLRLDCEANGCETPHRDNGEVMHYEFWLRSPMPDTINDHAVTKVTRVVGPWVDDEDKTSPVPWVTPATVHTPVSQQENPPS